MRLRLALHPRNLLRSLQRSSDPLAGFGKGVGKGGEGKGRKRKGREGREKEGEINPAPRTKILATALSAEDNNPFYNASYAQK